MKKLLAIALLGLCGPVQAATVIIDFDGASLTGQRTMVVPQGFNISTDGDFLATPDTFPGFCPIVGGPPPSADNIFCAVSTSQQFTTVDFERQDSTDFDLLEMDVYLINPYCDNFNCDRGDQVVINAWNENDELIAQTAVSIAEYGFGWSTVQFDSTWAGISRFSYTAQEEIGMEASSFAYLDNIKVNVVPIPAAVWLFGSGLGLLGWIHRRKTT